MIVETTDSKLKSVGIAAIAVLLRLPPILHEYTTVIKVVHAHLLLTNSTKVIPILIINDHNVDNDNDSDKQIKLCKYTSELCNFTKIIIIINKKNEK